MVSENPTQLDKSQFKELEDYEIDYVGNLNLLYEKKFTVVGTRKMSGYGKRVTKDLCKNFVRHSIVTVSGFVNGVDMQTFRQTLAYGGATIVCLGYGFDHLSMGKLKAELRKVDKLSMKFQKEPSEFFSMPSNPAPEKNSETSGSNLKSSHSELVSESSFNNEFSSVVSDFDISAENLLILSQFPKKQRGTSWTFPKRDKLLADLGRGVVAVEAGKTSGTFYTVKRALGEEKKVLSVPGSIYSEQSKGTNRMIQKGFKMYGEYRRAELYRSFDQILNIFNIKSKAGGGDESKNIEDLGEKEKKLVNLLNGQKMHFDDLVEEVNLEASKLQVKLTELEVKGFIEKRGSKYISK